jgi:hypothetical protein
MKQDTPFAPGEVHPLYHFPLTMVQLLKTCSNIKGAFVCEVISCRAGGHHDIGDSLIIYENEEDRRVR